MTRGWRHIFAMAFAAALGLGAGWPLAAEEHAAATPGPATLIADDIRFQSRGRVLEARGAVEVFYGGSRLTASAIVYDGATDRLEVVGPLTLTDPDGRATLIADFAELSGDLQDGVLRSARLVLDRQLQIAATQIDRSEGRYTELFQTVASSCEVCADNPTPLWEIRARRVIHDTEERQLYFENAQVRAFGVPVFYIPRLRLPDPTLERATGFLVPSVFGNNYVGSGLRVPYFVVLGPQRDLTFSPYILTNGGGGTGLRYRQAWARGWLDAEGQVSFDDITDRSMRHYVFADGYFALARGYDLNFALETVSDPGYLLAYEISERDILESYVSISRARRDSYAEARAAEFQSLREGVDNAQLPNTQIDLVRTRRFEVPGVGGMARLSFAAHLHERSESADILGRDVARVSADAEWRRDWILPLGILVAAEAAVEADLYSYAQDSTLPGSESRVVPYAAVELRWPFSRDSGGGVTHLIEPTIQLAWSDDGGATVANEDSIAASFDEGNLFALDRFPGNDAREVGTRLAFGVTYTRSDPSGVDLGLALGRIWRSEDRGQFTSASGLDGMDSDWLVAVHLGLGDRVRVVNRTLFADLGSITSNELALALGLDRLDLVSGVTWLTEDPAAGRPQDTAEWQVAARYDLSEAWTADVEWRYDFVENSATRAGLGLTYSTECIDVNFSASRRFTSSVTVEPATELGLEIAFTGFGSSGSDRPRARRCAR